MGDWTKEIRHEERMVLHMEFLEPMSMTSDELTEGAGVPAQRIRGLLVRGEGTIAPDLSCRRGRYFGMGEGPWARVRTHYDL